MRKVGHTSEFSFAIYWLILKNQKNYTFEKMKKIARDIIILHMCTKTHNHMKYSSWDTKRDRIFCHFWPFFCFIHPLPPNNPQNQNLKKMKKTSRDVIILNLCNKKKHDHMMYAYSDMECLDRHNFLSFQPIFCFFARLLTSKIKIVKNHRDILPFYTCAPLIKIIWCSVPEIWSSAELFCHLGHFFALLPL